MSLNITKSIQVGILLMVLIVFSACTAKKGTGTDAALYENTSEVVTDFDSLADAAETLGYGIEELPDEVCRGYSLKKVQTVGESILRLTYEGSDPLKTIILRKGFGIEKTIWSEFQEYDYRNLYGEDAIYKALGTGEDEAFVVVWYERGYNDEDRYEYSLVSSDPLTFDKLVDMARSIHKQYKPLDQDKYYYSSLSEYICEVDSNFAENYPEEVVIYEQYFTKNYLEKLAEECDAYLERPRFQLVYIDEDDIPEIVLGFDPTHSTGIHIYGLCEGEVVYYGEYSSFGSVWIAERHNRFYSSYGNQGYFCLPVTCLTNQGTAKLVGYVIDNNSRHFYANMPLPKSVDGSHKDHWFGIPVSESGVDIPDATEEYEVSEEEYNDIFNKLMGTDEVTCINYLDMVTVTNLMF